MLYVLIKFWIILLFIDPQRVEILTLGEASWNIDPERGELRFDSGRGELRFDSGRGELRFWKIRMGWLLYIDPRPSRQSRDAPV